MKSVTYDNKLNDSKATDPTKSKEKNFLIYEPYEAQEMLNRNKLEPTFFKSIIDYLYKQPILNLYLYLIILSLLFFTITKSSLKLFYNDFSNINYIQNALLNDGLNQPFPYMFLIVNLLILNKAIILNVTLIILSIFIAYKVFKYFTKRAR